MHRTFALLSLSILAVACSKPTETDTSTTAQPLTSASAGGEHERGRPNKGEPPAEAFDACTGKTAGTACTVKRGDKEMPGTCESPVGGTDTRLSCRPSGPPGREH